ncbi:STAS domain-containing protein [Acidocella sp.]|uniref:STAS domain-containing protein n=1 Tax=Acidocella sp. TaxID=50710 RepID=UPI00345A91A5
MVGEVWSVIKLSGTIDIRSIIESFSELNRAVSAGSPIEIDLTDIIDIDLSFLQLLESTRKSAAQSSLPIRLSKPAHGIILDALNRGGFLNDPSNERAQFWLGSTEQKQ